MVEVSGNCRGGENNGKKDSMIEKMAVVGLVLVMTLLGCGPGPRTSKVLKMYCSGQHFSKMLADYGLPNMVVRMEGEENGEMSQEEFQFFYDKKRVKAKLGLGSVSQPELRKFLKELDDFPLPSESQFRNDPGYSQMRNRLDLGICFTVMADGTIGSYCKKSYIGDD